MQVTFNIDVGIRDIRQLMRFIKEKHGVDYSEYALTSFRRRLEKFLIANKFGLDTLFYKLESKEFLDYFIGQIAVSVTEMFRDSTFWILLKNNYIANIIKEHSKAKIWLPLCASGEEFYSLAILLKENGWTEHVEIFVSSMSDKTLEAIQNGRMEFEKLEISVKNYSRFQGTGQLANYFKNSDNVIEFDKSLFVNTRFFKEGIEFNCDLPQMHLILFRNQMIYFNPSLQFKMCDLLYDRLMPKGLLALGILEEIEMNFNNKFIALNKEESIYQRRQ